MISLLQLLDTRSNWLTLACLQFRICGCFKHSCLTQIRQMLRRIFNLERHMEGLEEAGIIHISDEFLSIFNTVRKTYNRPKKRSGPKNEALQEEVKVFFKVYFSCSLKPVRLSTYRKQPST